MSGYRFLLWVLVLIMASATCQAKNYTITANANLTFTSDFPDHKANITINAGDTVTFTNSGGGFHNVVANNGSFRCATSCSGSGGNASSAAWSDTIPFPTAGSFGYYCEIHGGPGAGMAGTITVNAVAAPAPVINSFTPSGSAGDSINIVGVNFSTTASANTVKFNGTPANVTAATATSLSVTVPANATTGPISVTVDGQTTTSTSNFTVVFVTEPPPGKPISGSTSGAWYNPAQSGHGFIIQVYDSANTFLAVWFVYTADGTQQAWIWAQGTYDPTSSSITIADAFYTKGGRFPPNFVPGSATHIPWGTITFNFSDCNTGTATWSSSIPEYGSGSMPLTRLAGIKGLTCQ